MAMMGSHVMTMEPRDQQILDNRRLKVPENV
jgi:hypothetical protein